MELKRMRPSPAMVVACLALFVALGSGAYAAVKLKPNSVKSKNIKNNAVTGPKIAGGAVSSGKIANGAVTALQLQNNAVTSPKITDLAVNNAKIGPEAVAAGKIAPGALIKSRFATSGIATNTGAFNLNGTCTVATFSASGVRPGDVVAFSFRDAPTVNGLLVLQPAEDMVGTDQLKLQVCEQNAVAANIGIGSLLVDFVAIRG